MMALTIRRDLAEVAGGAVLRVTEVAGYHGAGAIAIRREGHVRCHLGPEGWEAEPAEVRASRWQFDDQGQLDLYLGPEIVRFLLPDDPVTIEVKGVSLIAALPWPGGPISADVPVTAGRRAALPFRPPARPQPAPVEPASPPPVAAPLPPLTAPAPKTSPTPKTSPPPPPLSASRSAGAPVPSGSPPLRAEERPVMSFSLPPPAPPPPAGGHGWIIRLIFLLVCFAAGAVLWQRFGTMSAAPPVADTAPPAASASPSP